MIAQKQKIDLSEELRFNYDMVLSQIDDRDVFQKFVMSLFICPITEEMTKILKELDEKYRKQLDSYSILDFLVKLKLGDEITKCDENSLRQYGNLEFFRDLNQYYINGKENFRLFRKYFIQYDLIVLQKFFSQISMTRISEHIGIDHEEVEKELCDMVNNGYIYAKINRIQGIVSFRKKQIHEDKINNINTDLTKMLDILERTCHLIHKENLKSSK